MLISDIRLKSETHPIFALKCLARRFVL